MTEIPLSLEWKITMTELPNVIPSALVHVNYILESDDTHQFQWKMTRNLENISLFVKCILPPKSVTHGKVVPRSLPVKPAGKKSRKKKMPSALRRSANILKRFKEKQAAEQATLSKSLPQKSLVSSEGNRKPSLFLRRTFVTILESSNRSPSKRSTSET